MLRAEAGNVVGAGGEERRSRYSGQRSSSADCAERSARLLRAIVGEGRGRGWVGEGEGEGREGEEGRRGMREHYGLSFVVLARSHKSDTEQEARL